LSNDEQTEDHNKKYKFKQVIFCCLLDYNSFGINSKSLSILKETNEIIDSCFKKMAEVDPGLENDEYVKKVHEIIENEAKKTNNPYFKLLVNKI
jgi:hypothetical protein